MGLNDNAMRPATEVREALTTNSFPAPGHSYTADFGEFAFRLDFHVDGKSMTFEALGDTEGIGGEGSSQTITYTAVPIRAGVFLVYWQEAGGTTVTHVEDFERNILHSNITASDGGFLNLSGTFTPIA